MVYYIFPKWPQQNLLSHMLFYDAISPLLHSPWEPWTITSEVWLSQDHRAVRMLSHTGRPQVGSSTTVSVLGSPRPGHHTRERGRLQLIPGPRQQPGPACESPHGRQAAWCRQQPRCTLTAALTHRLREWDETHASEEPLHNRNWKPVSLQNELYLYKPSIKILRNLQRKLYYLKDY